jgi:hypothetical protein
MLRNVTFSTDGALLERARQKAQEEGRALNEVFRDWLERYVATPAAAGDYAALMKDLSHVRAGRKYTREEMNERR